MAVVTGRIAALDIVRGVAVLGILAANIAAFGLPEAAYFSPRPWGGTAPADLAAWAATFVFVEGKMRGLFTVLFGASLLLVAERAEAGGASAAAVHYRRMFWLFCFGAVHLYLFWWGDILTHYALIGSVAFLFRRLAVRWLVLLGLGFLLLQLLEFAALALEVFRLSAAAHAPGASPRVLADWAAYANSFGEPAPAIVARELAASRGGFAGLVAFRWTQAFNPFVFALVGGADTLGLMLLGMAGFRSGFLTGVWRMARYRSVALIALGVGLPLYAAIAWHTAAHGFDARHVFLGSMVLAELLRPLTVAGYAAAILVLAQRRGWLVERVAAAGRMAFSNYLGTTLICTTLFYGYGFGLFGHLSRAQLWLVVGPVWAVILLWSKPWLERFRYGPLEWAWRSLARGQLQPIRRS